MSYQVMFIMFFHTDQRSESNHVKFVSLVPGDSAYSSQVCLLMFLMHIYVLAKNYLGWVTTHLGDQRVIIRKNAAAKQCLYLHIMFS